MRPGTGSANGRTRRPARAASVGTASAGSGVTPAPPATVRASVGWLVARNPSSRAEAPPQPASARSRKPWPSSSRSTFRSARSAARTRLRPRASGWSGAVASPKGSTASSAWSTSPSPSPSVTTADADRVLELGVLRAGWLPWHRAAAFPKLGAWATATAACRCRSENGWVSVTAGSHPGQTRSWQRASRCGVSSPRSRSSPTRVGGSARPAPWPPPPLPEAALVTEVARPPASDLVGLAAVEAGWVAGAASREVWRPAGRAAGLPATAVVATERGPGWSADAALQCREDGVVREVVSDAFVMVPGQLAAVSGALAWVDHGAVVVSALDRATGQRQVLADQRRPRDLLAFGATVAWSESEADLLPNHQAVVTVATRGPDGGWTVAASPHEPSGQPVAVAGGLAFGPAWCVPAAGGAGIRFDTGEGLSPTAVGGDRWAWTVLRASGERIVAAPRSACRPWRAASAEREGSRRGVGALRGGNGSRPSPLPRRSSCPARACSCSSPSPSRPAQRPRRRAEGTRPGRPRQAPSGPAA